LNVLFPAVLGLVLGFSITVPPGPMNALIAGRSARSFRLGFTTGLGAMSADAILAVAVYIVRAAVNFGGLLRWVDVVGAAVLSVMVYRLATEPPRTATPAESDVRTYSTALVVGLTNPFQVLWWVTAGLAFAYAGGLPLFVGLFAAISIWIVLFPYVVAEGSRRDPRVPALVTLVSAVLLAGFAAYFALRAAGITV
jgi:threonine/homoserine/homoserine lactone efflux protein